MSREWLTVAAGDAPLIVSIPHAGTEIPADIETRLASGWLARKDADLSVDRLYAFAGELGATLVATRLSRTVVDVNRDPAGAAMYPGAFNTGLCPLTTFDAEPLYRAGAEPGPGDIEARKARYWEPYHAELAAQIARLRTRHPSIVLYDAHSIRSVAPVLFEGTLPHINIGTNSGVSCGRPLMAAVAEACGNAPFSQVVDGRFKGGYITRHYGAPSKGVHAIQVELAMRGYLREPAPPHATDNWPPPYDAPFAAPLREVLARMLEACLRFASSEEVT
jgi:N-formylglutamate deformylase